MLKGYGIYLVCLSVCLSVYLYVSLTQHLTFQVIIHSKADTTYLTGNEGQKFQTVFSENAAFESYGIICLLRQHSQSYLIYQTIEASIVS